MSDFQFRDPGSRCLVRSWRQKSAEAGWRFPEDWWVSEVDRLVWAWSGGECLIDPARGLGASRAYNGVGVRETMLDVDSLFSALGVPVDPGVMRAVVEGWVTENERVKPFSCTDVNTGMATPAHFGRLVYDLSLGSEGEREKRRIASLALVSGRDPGPLPWSIRVEIGRAFHTQFTGIDVTGTLDLRAVHVVIPSTFEAYFALLRFVSNLEELAVGPVGLPPVHLQEIPADRAEYNRVVEDLRRRARA